MTASSAEIIAAQHDEALRLVNEEKMSCAPRQELGEISLKDKEQPVSNYFSNDDDNDEKKEKEITTTPPLQNPICFSTRGDVDVSALQALVTEGYNLPYSKDENDMPPLSPTNYWDPRNAAKLNVTITRPSHDGWGIGKIVLLFCDDFLTRIYQLPYYKVFENALQPVLDACMPQGQGAILVRALLASLPPGVTIPVHHDTGEWVKTTHRVHVPIVVQNSNNILFRCGPTPESMQRIDCIPGHVFEINNQAKHAVSNCDTHCRVHLILDYVVPGCPTTTTTTPPSPCHKIVTTLLEAGERLVQTRRSIDRLKDIQSRPTPSYIILGAQKAGTTSLYDYINQHPWVVKARRRETHCLDWRWNETIQTPKKQLEWCQKFFYTEELKAHPSCLTGDSTPSYLLDSRRVIPRIQKIFDWKMQFFCMLRDPVPRAISHYAMVTSSDGTPAQLKTRGVEWRKKTFWQVVILELEKMNDCGLIPYWNIQEGVMDKRVFDEFCNGPQEDQAWSRYLEKHIPLNTGSYGLLTRGMYALQLRPWFQAFERDQFLVLRLESMKKSNGGVEETMRKVWAHLDLPNHPVLDETPKNTRDYKPMDVTVKGYLERFFEPHNRRLAKLLGDDDDDEEWKDPWPYDAA